MIILLVKILVGFGGSILTSQLVKNSVSVSAVRRLFNSLKTRQFSAIRLAT